MASYSIEGIVLRHADYRENDRMLTLLTPRGRAIPRLQAPQVPLAAMQRGVHAGQLRAAGQQEPLRDHQLPHERRHAQPQQQEQMSKDNAQQMLDAFLQDEKDTQEKVKKAQAQQQQRRRTDKEW